MANSGFAVWNFLEFCFQIFSTHGWLNPWMWNSQIWRDDCNSCADKWTRINNQDSPSSSESPPGLGEGLQCRSQRPLLLRNCQLNFSQFSLSVVSISLQSHGLKHARVPCPLPTPGVHSNSCPSIWWCHPTISSSVIPFSSFLQSLPASRPFPMSQLFPWGGQSIGVSASASVLPVNNTQDWSPLGWTGWISLQSKGLSIVFSNTTVQKHQFFGTQLSSQSNSHICTWPLEKP